MKLGKTHRSPATPLGTGHCDSGTTVRSQQVTSGAGATRSGTSAHSSRAPIAAATPRAITSGRSTIRARHRLRTRRTTGRSRTSSSSSASQLMRHIVTGRRSGTSSGAPHPVPVIESQRVTPASRAALLSGRLYRDLLQLFVGAVWWGVSVFFKENA